MISLLRWLARWPLWLLHALGAALGWLTYLASPSYRQRLQDQVAQAGLDGAVRRASVAQAGRMVAELPWLWLAPRQRNIQDWVQWQGAELLDAAVASGRGLLLMTPHLGSFEVCAQAYAQRFGSRSAMTALYRPARKAWLRELEEESRDRPGLVTAPASLAGVRQMIRALRRGETVGLLPDQVPPQGMGVWAPFFGRPAYTMTLATRLLEQTGAALLLMWCERRPGGRGWVLHVVDPQTLVPQAPSEVSQQAPSVASAQNAANSPEAINTYMETLIRQAPDQYLWGYHRYKEPRGGDGAAA